MYSGTLAASAVGRGSSEELGPRAKVWNPRAMAAGPITAALIIPVFGFRHAVQGRGTFSDHMLTDIGLHAGDLDRRAGAAGPPAAPARRRKDWCELDNGETPHAR